MHNSNRRAPPQSHAKREELDHLAMAVGAHFKTNFDIHQDLVKKMHQFKQAIGQMREAADALAQVGARLNVTSSTTFQHQRDFEIILGWHEKPAYMEKIQTNARRERQLSAALNQLVRFQMRVVEELQRIDHCIQDDFDQPVLANMELYRDLASHWEKEYEKEMKRLQSNIKTKEQESARIGKKKPSLAEKMRLQEALSDLSLSVSQMEARQVERLEVALRRDQRQQLVAAHHLQKVLKVQIQSFKNVSFMIYFSLDSCDLDLSIGSTASTFFCLFQTIQCNNQTTTASSSGRIENNNRHPTCSIHYPKISWKFIICFASFTHTITLNHTLSNATYHVCHEYRS
jgi:hypothetical protein